MKKFKLTKGRIAWIVYWVIVLFLVLVGSTNDVYNFMSSLAAFISIAFVACLVIWLINRKKHPQVGSRYLKYSLATFIAVCVLQFGSQAFYKGSIEQKQDIAESAKESSESKASSASSAKKASDKSAAKSSAKKESSEEASASSSNAKKNTKTFEHLISEMPQKSKGLIQSATTDTGGSGVNIYLSSEIDNASSDDVQKACYTLWKEINSAASSYNISPVYINIYDDGNNIIAKTKAFGGYKYVGQ